MPLGVSESRYHDFFKYRLVRFELDFCTVFLKEKRKVIVLNIKKHPMVV